MDAAQLLAALRRRWLVVVALTLVGAVAGLAYATLSTPRYTASTTVFLSLQGGGSVNELAQGTTYTQDLVQSYAQIATLPTVLAPVVSELGLTTTPAGLARDIQVETPASTALMRITAHDPSARQAAQVADAVAARLAETVADLAPERDDDTAAVALQVVAPADVPEAPSSPVLPLDVAVGAVVGLLLGAGLALLLEVVRTPVSTREQVARMTAAPVVGTFGRERGRAVQQRGPGAEAYRVLRTNIRFLQTSGDVRTLVVTSARGGEGRTSTALGLAASMAELSAHVLLVDADLRRPEIADVLDLDVEVGLTSVLLGDTPLAAAVLPVRAADAPGFDVLPAGPVPPNPSELLGSAGMETLLAELRGRYDLVVLDSPALLPVTDAAVLAAACDGALLVVDSPTPQRQVSESIGRLRTAGAQLRGVVLGAGPMPLSAPVAEEASAQQSSWPR